MSKEIKTNVRQYIASHAKMKLENVLDEHVLKEHPLKFDDINLKYLAMSLRGYVRKLNKDATILAADLKAAGMTVKKTYELVIERVDQ